MDHTSMDHDSMGMGGGQCSMNMLFTWSTHNLCIVFRQWHITGNASLLVSLAAIALLTAGYEGVREISRRYELSHATKMSAFSSSASSEATPPNETSSLLGVGRDSKQAAERKGMLVKAALYAVQVFYSFFIMLLFMTYNGFVMLAVTVGAFIGYLAFGSGMSSVKSVACH